MNMIAKITSAMRMRLDIISRKAPPRPRWESSAAMPRPAAMPAMGPRKRDMPLRAAVPAAAPVAADGDVALRWVVLAAGALAAGWFCVTRDDCEPKLLPPPKRRASASNETDTMPTAQTASRAEAKKRDKRWLIECSCVARPAPRGAGQGNGIGLEKLTLT